MWKSEEMIITIIPLYSRKSVSLVILFLFLTDYYDLETSFRKALFQVATAHTSCGFTSDDYNLMMRSVTGV